ncbi:MAG: BrnT family toxin [Parvularculaceae bacterium]
MLDLGQIEGFQWDAGNSGKNEGKHGVGDREAEQVFFNKPVLLDDPKHSAREPRSHAVGLTDDGRLLHVSFTLREEGKLIRVISARPLNRKERTLYDEETKADP